MSTIYLGERQSGKTTMLIEMSEKTGATIVVATYPMGKYIQKQITSGFLQAVVLEDLRSILLTSFK